MKTYLSGIQPTGRQHLGNYFGAIQQHIDLQREEGDLFYFIADYHALTTTRDAAELRDNTLEMAITYLACGLDPERVALFRQSDVPEVCELTWLLACGTGMGLLERAHSYKDKLQRGIKPNVGLFTYPILMAADILAYDSNVVPVGKDQIQHVEMAQDMAQSFNHLYAKNIGRDVFVRPEPRIPENELKAKVPGTDGEKMGKSYGNSIWVFESGKKLKKAVGGIVTDSRLPEVPKDPDGVLLLRFLELFLEPDDAAEWGERVRRGGQDAPGYGHLKARLVEAIDEHLAPARAKREEYLSDPAEVDRILARGAEIARPRARATLERALQACGIR